MESSSLSSASSPATFPPSSAAPAATDRATADPATSSSTSRVGVSRPFDLPSDGPASSNDTRAFVFTLPCCGLSAAGKKAEAQDKQFLCYSFPPQSKNGRVPLDHLSWRRKNARYFSSGIQGYPLQHQQQITGQAVGTQYVGPEAPPKVVELSSGLHAMEHYQPIAEPAAMLHQIPLLPPPWCDICRVDCTTTEALEKHRNGRRHRRTLQLLQQIDGQLEMVKSASNDCVKPEQVGAAGGSGVADLQSPSDAKSKKRKRSKRAEPEQARLCTLCDATCNSQAMFEAHLAGKKHLSKLKRFQGPNTVYGPVSAPTLLNRQSDLAAPGVQPLCYALIHYGQPLPPS